MAVSTHTFTHARTGLKDSRLKAQGLRPVNLAAMAAINLLT